MNKFIAVGNLVSNPEFKINESGKKIGKLRLAINSFSDKEETVFLNVMYFDNLAESCQKWLQKGSKILVDGRLCYRNIESDGTNKDYFYIVARNIEFLKNTKEKINEISISVEPVDSDSTGEVTTNPINHTLTSNEN